METRPSLIQQAEGAWGSNSVPMGAKQVIHPLHHVCFWWRCEVCVGMDHKFTWIGFLSILSISLPTRESGIRRDKYLSAAIFKKVVHSDDP